MEDRRVENYVNEHGTNLTPAQKAEAIRVGKIAYRDNTTLKDAGETGILAAKDKNEDNRSKGNCNRG